MIFAENEQQLAAIRREFGRLVDRPPSACSESFELAFLEYRLGRYVPIRAYLGLMPGLRFGPCAACHTIGFNQRSGLKGWTCSRCELELNKHLSAEASQ